MKKSALLFSSALSLFSASLFADYSTAKNYLNKQEYKKAFSELLVLAKSGHTESQFLVAQAYHHGQGIEADINQAYAWYLIAKDFGHPQAKAKYSELRKLVPSRREAKNHYRTLSNEFGFKTHQLKYAPVVKHTNFFPERAKLKHTKKSLAKQSIETPYSAWSTVAFNINESGIVEDARIIASFPKGLIDNEVLKLVKQWEFEQDISPTGVPRRTFDIVKTFVSHGDSSKTSREFNKTLKQYASKLKALADKGNGYAQHRYALMLENELIASQDNEHIDWYYQSAINGNHDSQLRLMHCFKNGEGCQPDEEKAHSWLVKAANSGNQRAQYQLALDMLNYESIYYDVAKAAEILKTTAHKQYLPAMVTYSHLLAFSDEPQVRNAQAAVKYAELARAMDNNHPVLLSVLGSAYTELGRIQQGQTFLQQAVHEATNRNWPAQNYINLIEQPQSSMMADTD